MLARRNLIIFRSPADILNGEQTVDVIFRVIVEQLIAINVTDKDIYERNGVTSKRGTPFPYLYVFLLKSDFLHTNITLQE